MSALQSVAVNLPKRRLRRGVAISALARAANVSIVGRHRYPRLGPGESDADGGG
jgi:hypothetical protein